MKKQGLFTQIMGMCLIVILLSCGGNRVSNQTKTLTTTQQTPLNKPKYGVFVPKIEEIRRIAQNPSWGQEAMIQDVAPVDGENLYLVDYRLVRIFEVDETGKLLHLFLKKGQGPGEFQHISKIQGLGNNLWISEYQKLDRFSMDGVLRDEIRLRHSYNDLTMVDTKRFAGVREAVEGDKKNGKRVKRAGLWDLKENRLKLYRQSDKLGLFQFNQGKNYITLRFSGGIIPELISATDPIRGRVYICETDHYRIDVVDLDGNPVRTIERQVEPVIYSVNARKKTVEKIPITGVDQRTLNKLLMKQLPDRFCPVSDMFVTSDGYLMVSRIVNPDYSGLDVFSPEGKYLTTWINPKGVKLVTATFFTHDRFAVIDDSGDIPVVIEYRIVPEGGK